MRLQTGFPLASALLASSCCVIQLLLNALSLGCGGFAVLTPYEPFFLGLTALLLGFLFYKYGFTRRNILVALLSITLALSRQGVVAYNAGYFSWLFGASSATSAASEPQQIMQLTITGVKCESCAAKLRPVLLPLSHSLSVTLDGAHQQAFARLYPRRLVTEGDLRAAVQRVGYDVSEVQWVAPETFELLAEQ